LNWRAPNLPPEEFIARFLARMPPHLAKTFTVEQLEAIRQAFGVRYRSSHRLQIRRYIRFLKWKFYIVVQAGRDRRQLAAPWPEHVPQQPPGEDKGASCADIPKPSVADVVVQFKPGRRERPTDPIRKQQ
jgi:hypothetical protein